MQRCTGRLISKDFNEEQFWRTNETKLRLFNDKMRVFIQDCLKDETRDSFIPYQLSDDPECLRRTTLVKKIMADAEDLLPAYSLEFTPETEHLKNNIRVGAASIFYEILSQLPVRK